MITIEKIADAYEKKFGEDAVEWLATIQFQDLDFKAQFELLELAKWRNIEIEFIDGEIDWWKFKYTWSVDKTFNFYEMLKDIEKQA